MWIGTDQGLARLVEPRFTVFTRRDGLAANAVGAIYQDGEGSIWVGTGSGLSRFTNGAFTVFTTRDGLPDDRIQGIAGDDRGGLWIRTRSGLARWKNGRFVRDTDVNVAGIRWDRVLALLWDRSGTLWLGSDAGGLIQVRDRHATTFSTKDGLADDTVLTLFQIEPAASGSER